MMLLFLMFDKLGEIGGVSKLLWALAKSSQSLPMQGVLDQELKLMKGPRKVG